MAQKRCAGTIEGSSSKKSRRQIQPLLLGMVAMATAPCQTITFKWPIKSLTGVSDQWETVALQETGTIFTPAVHWPPNSSTISCMPHRIFLHLHVVTLNQKHVTERSLVMQESCEYKTRLYMDWDQTTFLNQWSGVRYSGCPLYLAVLQLKLSVSWNHIYKLSSCYHF